MLFDVIVAISECHVFRRGMSVTDKKNNEKVFCINVYLEFNLESRD